MKLLTAIGVARQASSSLFLDSLKPQTFGNSQRARAAVRDSYFSSRAIIPTVPLNEFLHSISTAVSDSVSLLTDLANYGLGSADHFFALAAVAASRKPRRIVEIGTYLGASARIFAINSEAEILTVDLPDDQNAKDFHTLNSGDKTHVADSRYRVGEFYKGTPEEPRIGELRYDSRSLDLASLVSDVDLVYIDGGHDTASVSADTANGFNVLSPRGVMLWDDYFWLYPDVVNFLEALAKKRTLVCIANTHLVAYVNTPGHPMGPDLHPVV